VDPRLLTIEQVARRLAVSAPTVRRMMRQGSLRPVRLRGSVRFRPDDVERLIADSMGAPAQSLTASRT